VKRAIITVGLGFGDEGKGATVDFLTREFEAELVIRYCGGSQAGHNVELLDGRRHTFSQFGAGTLAPTPARTFLGPAVVIDPPALMREAQHLAELGVASPLQLVTIHPQCLVTTPWLRMLNRIRELSRGDTRHGSCGVGVGEARNYWLKHGGDAVFASDLQTPDLLRQKLELQRQRVLLEVQPLLAGCSPKALNDSDLLAWETSANYVAEMLCDPRWREIKIHPDAPPHKVAILEGAQGVLLDEYRGFHPHTTWSTVTPHHAWELVEQMGSEEVALLGITRAFTTRHGAGPLPTYSEELTTRFPDPGNPWNAWQGQFRYGWLDLELLRYAATVAGPLDGLVVNHLDQIHETDFQLCEGYRNQSLTPASQPNLAWQSHLTEQVQNSEPILTVTNSDRLLRTLEAIAPIVIKGNGPTHVNRTSTGLTFRKKRL